jgi:hypothetical protein
MVSPQSCCSAAAQSLANASGNGQAFADTAATAQAVQNCLPPAPAPAASPKPTTPVPSPTGPPVVVQSVSPSPASPVPTNPTQIQQQLTNPATATSTATAISQALASSGNNCGSPAAQALARKLYTSATHGTVWLHVCIWGGKFVKVCCLKARLVQQSLSHPCMPFQPHVFRVVPPILHSLTYMPCFLALLQRPSPRPGQQVPLRPSARHWPALEQPTQCAACHQAPPPPLCPAPLLCLCLCHHLAPAPRHLLCLCLFLAPLQALCQCPGVF